MQVVPANDERAGHLGGYDPAGQDAPTDGNVTSEGALLVWRFRPDRSFTTVIVKDQLEDVPMYVPLIASEGVLNPRPTSLYHRFSFVDTFFPPALVHNENQIP